MRKMIIVAMILLFITTLPVQAEQIRHIQVFVNNNKINFDTEPIEKDNRIFVPLTSVFKEFGTVVFSNGLTNMTIALTRDGDYIEHQIGSNIAMINGSKRVFDTVSLIENDCTFVPVRFVAELLNADISYDENADQIDINKYLFYNDYNKLIEEVLNCSREPYFNPELFKRYLEYKSKHTELSGKQSIIHVNIGLDHPFYTNIKTIQYPNELLVLCNKYNKLPDNFDPYNIMYVPSDYYISDGKEYKINNDVLNAFKKMSDDAKKAGFSLKIISGLRTQSYQADLYNVYASKNGLNYADQCSARAGHSEHQTGLAYDINNVSESFENSGEFRWLQSNAYGYGFILRYPKNKEEITGYHYEPWHYRYVGVEVATQLYNEGITFDEFCATYVKQTDYHAIET